MDVLVVVGEADPPGWLATRAGHVLKAGPGDLDPELVAHIRTHIPRMVGVYGDPAVAERLRQHGFPVSVVEDDAGPPMDTADSLLDLVGNTPMVRLDRMARNLSCHVLAKLEFLNAGGSVKDRPAVAMIDAAERDGRLKPGGTIVEPTSGNTGVGLAIVAARRKYRCVFVMPDKMSAEKIALLRAYGAEVVVCPTAVPPEHPDSYYSVSDRLAAEIPGGFKPDQYHNPANPESHVQSTGPEVWRQTAGRVTHFVAGIGTGGTITGVGRSLKSLSGGAVQIVGADPAGSVYSGGTGRPYLVEGIGEDFWPTTYDPSVVDRVVMVSDRDSFLTARAVTREEGILVGGSAGTAVWAALHVGAELGPSDVVVVLIPDSGRGYLSKLYNDGWMADYGFLRSTGPTIADVLARKDGGLPTLVHVHPDEPGRDVIAVLREYQVSQVPVVKAEPPLAAAEVVGSISERDLLEKAFTDTGVLDRPVGEVMGPPLPTVGAGEPVDAAVEALEGAWAVLVLDSGHPVGIVTRSDLLDFLARRVP
ncbi:MAG TPA: cystathionine beta-synthase [Acidimicrobiales bacterium]|nr:cystathionine beta-synthase [Acidimicrobiales bacterium]